MNNKFIETDVLIAGCGCSGLYMAMNLPKEKNILMITKSDCESSDSFLAQGGMCMLKSEDDYDSYFEDTMKAGHYENDKESVKIMIRSSGEVVKDLIECGARFAREADGSLAYTREGAHSSNRIIFHEDVTGKEITSHLLEKVKTLPNVTIMEYTRLLDIISSDNRCFGAVIRDKDGNLIKVKAENVVLATGGIGGLYRHSTNFRHLTGDAVAIAIKHDVELKDINYVQIHPTTFYSKKQEDRSFLISESVRGEGAKLYDKNGKRFVNELLPRDLLTEEIKKQMAKDNTEFVWEDLRTIPEEELKTHFPNIVEHCKRMGYDPTKECIPVVPAQHYFMGGIKVDHESRTTMDNLYAVGETACNGVHGRNRLASNSLLESLVFAKRAAFDISENVVGSLTDKQNEYFEAFDMTRYENEDIIDKEYASLVNKKIEEADKAYEESIKKNYA
ncbi:MAG: L-aspartate oxidase [Lachnospira sp.]|nr:L-aspartate oxidase [Lachnospira sp.]MDD5829457.1 L-aspartate oxidase [Lachnospira sp.]